MEEFDHINWFVNALLRVFKVIRRVWGSVNILGGIPLIPATLRMVLIT